MDNFRTQFPQMSKPLYRFIFPLLIGLLSVSCYGQQTNSSRYAIYVGPEFSTRSYTKLLEATAFQNEALKSERNNLFTFAPFIKIPFSKPKANKKLVSSIDLAYHIAIPKKIEFEKAGKTVDRRLTSTQFLTRLNAGIFLNDLIGVSGNLGVHFDKAKLDNNSFNEVNLGYGGTLTMRWKRKKFPGEPIICLFSIYNIQNTGRVFGYITLPFKITL